MRPISSEEHSSTAPSHAAVPRPVSDAGNRTLPRVTNDDVQPQRSDVIAAEHVGLIHHVARQLSRKLNAAVDVDELVSAGALGLVQAAASFDADRGLSFSTFAVPRIRGSMLDELRRHDRVPRGIRRKMRAISAARESATRRLGREPRAADIAAEIGIGVAELRRWETDIAGTARVSLDRGPRALEDQERATYADAVADERAPSIEDEIGREQSAAILGAAIRGLKPQERNVLALYYYEELTLQECAHVLGLSASRVSQIRGEAVGKLRGQLRSALR